MFQKRSNTIHSYPTPFESLVDREFRLPIDRGRGTFQVQRTCEPAYVAQQVQHDILSHVHPVS